MNIVPAIANEFFATGRIGARFFFAPEPGIARLGAGGFGSAVFVFERERNSTEQTRSLFPNIACQEEGTDVLADAVVEVRLPALGLFLEWLPTDEDIKRGLPFEDGGELGLEGTGGSVGKCRVGYVL